VIVRGSSVVTVGIIGSGNTGANAAFFIAEKGIANVLLHDVREGLSRGKALDLMEAAPVRTYRTKITGTDSLDEVLRSPIIVISAGLVRKPDMKREELFDDNVAVIRELAGALKGRKDDVKVVIVTEPVDLLTTVFTLESALPREAVLGLGGLLDSTRLRYAVARDLDVSVEDVSALVVGRHNEEMIGLPHYCTVSGVPVLNLMIPEQFGFIIDETRKAGDFIAGMAGHSTSYYAPSASIAELVDAIVRDTRRLLPISVLLQGEYDVENVAMSIPGVVGREGLLRVLLPKLQESELEQFLKSARKMKDFLVRRAG
jgi:malate dehydrogenase